MNYTFDITLKTRTIFNNLLDTFTLEQLNIKPNGFNNTIFWNIKHIVITQQLLTYALSGLPTLISEKEIEAFRKGSKAEIEATNEDVDMLKEQLFTTLKQTKKDYNEGRFKDYNEYTVSTKSVLSNIKEALEFNNFHEGIHLGYILAMKKNL
ncbi:MAG: DinB family protein [Flavobacteriaceae bacterium]